MLIENLILEINLKCIYHVLLRVNVFDPIKKIVLFNYHFRWLQYVDLNVTLDLTTALLKSR